METTVIRKGLYRGYIICARKHIYPKPQRRTHALCLSWFHKIPTRKIQTYNACVGLVKNSVRDISKIKILPTDAA